MAERLDDPMRIAITLTTIHQPTVIEHFARNIRAFGHQGVEILVVGDKKTPSGVGEYCAQQSKAHGIPARYLGLEFQDDYLRRFPALNRHIPHNSFARRNIGDLYAYEEGFSLVIRVDDDNFPEPDDFIEFHENVGIKKQYQVLSSDNGWLNICTELKDRDGVPFYPRGYPYSRRWKDGKVRSEVKEVMPVINAGLWLGDPDVDAVTRLAKPIDAVEFRMSYGDQFVLDLGTWCPINTQNTGYLRKVIPASFVSPFVGRYDDIWSGYLLRKIMDHLGGYVSYGRPLLRQHRNAHNLWKDLELEMNGNLHTDHLIQCLQEIQLTRTDYAGCYAELADQLAGRIGDNKEVFSRLVEGMSVWAEAIHSLPQG